MSGYQVRFLGLHPLHFSEELLREVVCEPVGKTPESMDAAELAQRCDMWREQVRSNMQGLHLVELEVVGDFELLNLGEVSQDNPRDDSSQVPYDEKWLSEDGERALGYNARKGVMRARLAFWLHCVDASKPLHGPWGAVIVPKPTPMPARLSALMRYSLP